MRTVWGRSCGDCPADKVRAYGLKPRNAFLDDHCEVFRARLKGKVDRATFPSIFDASPSRDEDCGPLALRLVIKSLRCGSRSTDEVFFVHPLNSVRAVWGRSLPLALCVKTVLGYLHHGLSWCRVGCASHRRLECSPSCNGLPWVTPRNNGVALYSPTALWLHPCGRVALSTPVLRTENNLGFDARRDA